MESNKHQGTANPENWELCSAQVWGPDPFFGMRQAMLLGGLQDLQVNVRCFWKMTSSLNILANILRTFDNDVRVVHPTKTGNWWPCYQETLTSFLIILPNLRPFYLEGYCVNEAPKLYHEVPSMQRAGSLISMRTVFLKWSMVPLRGYLRDRDVGPFSWRRWFQNDSIFGTPHASSFQKTNIMLPIGLLNHREFPILRGFFHVFPTAPCAQRTLSPSVESFQQFRHSSMTLPFDVPSGSVDPRGEVKMIKNWCQEEIIWKVCFLLVFCVNVWMCVCV